MTRVSGVPVVALFDEHRQPVDALPADQNGYAALAKTPFYLEAGGQLSDSGRIVNEATGASAVVEGVARIRQGLPRAHRVHVTSGVLRAQGMSERQIGHTCCILTLAIGAAVAITHVAGGQSDPACSLL